MYNSLKRIYQRTNNVAYLTAAVTKGWITEAEKQQIIAETV